VGKCCSNVLRSLRAYGVAVKPVRTCVCEKRTILCTCVAHDARSHTYSRERGHIHPCIRVCRYTKYKHACMPGTYTYLHSSAQRNSIYHTQTCPTTTHSCEQAMYCTHLSVWSVVCKCCSNVLRSLRAYGVVGKTVRTCGCERRTIQRTCVAHDARSYTHQPSAISYTPMQTCMPTYKIQTRVHALHVYLPSFQCRTAHTMVLGVQGYSTNCRVKNMNSINN
jgi:hypothetical protein